VGYFLCGTQVCHGLGREGRSVDEHYRKSVPLAAKPFKKDGPLLRISMIAQSESDRIRKEGRNHEPAVRYNDRVRQI
jgi:hypothetical protein